MVHVRTITPKRKENSKVESIMPVHIYPITPGTFRRKEETERMPNKKKYRRSGRPQLGKYVKWNVDSQEGVVGRVQPKDLQNLELKSEMNAVRLLRAM